MERKVFKALHWALEQEAISPESLTSVAILRSELGSLSLPLQKDSTYHHQTDLDMSRQLEAQGAQTNSSPLSKASLVIIIGSRAREENLLLLGQAAQLVEAEGTILVGLENDLGGRSLQKTIKKECKCDVLSKSHAQLVIIRASEATKLSQMTAEYLEGPKLYDTSFASYPGTFSAKAIDQGSALLLQCVAQQNLLGHGVDVGCGYGYLGISLLETCPGITEIDFWDIERNSIDATRWNLKNRDLTDRGTVAWRDLFKLPPHTLKYDWAISNLPFHRGAVTDRTLPKRFVAELPRLLRNGGIGYLLWHSQPPDLSDACWSHYQEVTIALEERPYWVIRAKC